MYRRDDPRLRRTLNQLSQNLESANETAQAGLYSFGQHYIEPCFASIGNCFHSCEETCLPNRDERLRRNRARSRGRAELSFDFYDDWENDENDGLLGWGNDELDRLLSGANGYGTTGQPPRERGMSYGIRRDGRQGRRKSAVQLHDGGPDPTIIPSSSYFGFLGKLPWKLGGKGLRYKPSAADLTEHPGQWPTDDPENEPLMEDSADEEEAFRSVRSHRRKRSQTAGSGHTTDSLSSRGDIFPSEDEIDDAVPLDDEFASALERRATNVGDDGSSGHISAGKRGSRSRLSMRTVSSKSTMSNKRRTRGSSFAAAVEEASIPTISDLKREEYRVEREEEAEIERKRDAAARLAFQRGFNYSITAPELEDQTTGAPLTPTVSHTDIPSSTVETIPFPAFDAQTPNSVASESATTEQSQEAPNTDDIEPERPSTAFIPAKLPNFSNQGT